MLVMLTGLPGTGKSTLAAQIAERCGGIILSKDRMRAALFPGDLTEYSSRQDDFCFDLMLQTARWLLEQQGRKLILLDGRTFSKQCQRDIVIQFAEALALPLVTVECICKPETAVARLQADLAAGTHPARNRTPELYWQVRSSFEPVQAPKITVDTDLAVPESLYSNFRVS